jgi:hypothetical protein
LTDCNLKVTFCPARIVIRGEGVIAGKTGTEGETTSVTGRRKFLAFALLGMAWVLLLGVFLAVDHHRAMSGVTTSKLLEMGAELALVVGAFGFMTFQLATAPGLRGVAAESIEASQRRCLWTLTFIPLLVSLACPWLILKTQELLAHGGSPLARPFVIVSIVFLGWMMLGLLLLMLGIGHRVVDHALNDELSRVHRARAVRTGFIAAILGATGAYLAGFFYPQWTMLVLSAVPIIAIAAMATHFAVLEWRSDTVE